MQEHEKQDITLEHGLNNPKMLRLGSKGGEWFRGLNDTEFRLFQAAPRLLQALKDMLDADTAICENKGFKSDQAMMRIAAIDQAREAIAEWCDHDWRETHDSSGELGGGPGDHWTTRECKICGAIEPA